MKKFSSKLKQIEVEIDDAKYVLREMSGAVRDDYLEALDKRMEEVEEDGKKTRRVTKRKGMLIDLLCFTLLDSLGKPVSREFINNLPGSVVEELYVMADGLSGVSADAVDKKEAEAKNESGASVESGIVSP